MSSDRDREETVEDASDDNGDVIIAETSKKILVTVGR